MYYWWGIWGGVNENIYFEDLRKLFTLHYWILLPPLHQPRRKTIIVCMSWRVVTEACSRQVMLLPCVGCALPARSAGVSAFRSHEHFNVTGCSPPDNKRRLHSARTGARGSPLLPPLPRPRMSVIVWAHLKSKISSPHLLLVCLFLPLA